MVDGPVSARVLELVVVGFRSEIAVILRPQMAAKIARGTGLPRATHKRARVHRAFFGMNKLGLIL